MAGISIRGVSKLFGDAAAFAEVTLEIPDGAFAAILGPSGSGKTTLLRLLARFERPDAGTIAIGGEEVARPGHAVPAEARNLGMVFQSYALWPHMKRGGQHGLCAQGRGRRPPRAGGKDDRGTRLGRPRRDG